MAKRIPCSGCGELRWPTKGRAEILCRACRANRIASHGVNGYARGCRCGDCREAKRIDLAAYRQRRKARTGLAQKRRANRHYVTPDAIQSCWICKLPVFGNVRSDTPAHNDCRPPRNWSNTIRIAKDDRIAIYARDGWVCQICTEPVERELHPNHKMAPTLDHIIPRATSLFPDDSPDNLRLAHRVCNSRRGIKPA